MDTSLYHICCLEVHNHGKYDIRFVSFVLKPKYDQIHYSIRCNSYFGILVTFAIECISGHTSSIHIYGQRGSS